VKISEKYTRLNVNATPSRDNLGEKIVGKTGIYAQKF